MRLVEKMTLGLAVAVCLGAAAVPAGAVPVWHFCAVKEGGKFEAACTKEKANGGFEKVEVGGTEKSHSIFTLSIKDTKTAAGVAEVVCGGTGEGFVGPGKFGRIETIEIKASNCKAEKVCENVEEVTAIHLPWQTELFETESGTVRDKITEVLGQPGWVIKCKTLLGSKTDTCETEAGKEGSALMDETSDVVKERFESKSGKMKCSEGGAASGEVIGTSWLWPKIVMQNSPWKIPVGTSKIFKAEYKGWSSAANISVEFNNGSFIEETRPGPCAGKASLADAETCEIKIKCVGVAGSKAQILVKTTTWWITNGKEIMECT